jgi:hypothetical protein
VIAPYAASSFELDTNDPENRIQLAGEFLKQKKQD